MSWLRRRRERRAEEQLREETMRARRWAFGFAHGVTEEMFDFNGDVNVFCSREHHGSCKAAGAVVTLGGFFYTPCLCECHEIADFDGERWANRGLRAGRAQ